MGDLATSGASAVSIVLLSFVAPIPCFVCVSSIRCCFCCCETSFALPRQQPLVGEHSQTHNTHTNRTTTTEEGTADRTDNTHRTTDSLTTAQQRSNERSSRPKHEGRAARDSVRSHHHRTSSPSHCCLRVVAMVERRRAGERRQRGGQRRTGEARRSEAKGERWQGGRSMAVACSSFACVCALSLCSISAFASPSSIPVRLSALVDQGRPLRRKLATLS